MRFHTVEELGPKRSLTPEGFLVVKDATLARTGEQLYGPGECPLEPGPEGFVRVSRTPEEVFRQETIDSFAGKPVCNDHPEENGERIDVMPQNWKTHGIGVILDPRRGDGILDDLLVGDLLIFDREAIDAIESGKRELSCGYNADWFETGVGAGEQRNILGNHVALVDAGRCGPRCAIGDHEPKGDCCPMDKDRKGLKERIFDAFKRRDEPGLNDALGEMGALHPTDGGGHHVHVHLAPPQDSTADKKGDSEMAEEEKKEKVEDRRFTDAEIGSRFDAADKRFADLEKKCDDGFKNIMDKLSARDEEEKEEVKEDKGEDEAILNNLEMEAPPGTNDAARKARDSRYLEDSFQETVAIAEVLAPGIRIPSFDKSAKPGVTFDSMCRFRRSALDASYANGEGRAIIDQLLGGQVFDSKRMPCSDVRMLFRTAGNMQRSRNNGALTVGVGAGHATARKGFTLADIQKRNEEYYGRKK